MKTGRIRNWVFACLTVSCLSCLMLTSSNSVQAAGECGKAGTRCDDPANPNFIGIGDACLNCNVYQEVFQLDPMTPSAGTSTPSSIFYEQVTNCSYGAQPVKDSFTENKTLTSTVTTTWTGEVGASVEGSFETKVLGALKVSGSTKVSHANANTDTTTVTWGWTINFDTLQCTKQTQEITDIDLGGNFTELGRETWTGQVKNNCPFGPWSSASGSCSESSATGGGTNTSYHKGSVTNAVQDCTACSGG